MSDILPRSKPDYFNFCKVHEPVWDANLVALGISAPLMSSWKALNSTAENDFLAQEAARSAAKAATSTSDLSLRAARLAGAELIRLIKNTAISSGNPGVYAIAEIPAPIPPSELPPPGTPTNLRAELNEDGTLTIRWKNNNVKGVTGVVYMVRRQVGFSTGQPTEIVGITGGNSFLDDTCPTPPQDSPVIQYTVQGHRAGTEGDASAVFSVFMGTGAGGGAVILRTDSGMAGEGEQYRMAA